MTHRSRDLLFTGASSDTTEVGLDGFSAGVSDRGSSFSAGDSDRGSSFSAGDSDRGSFSAGNSEILS